MATIDIFVVAVVIAMSWLTIKSGYLPFRTGRIRGPLFLASGVLFTGIFYVADFVTMLILPTVLSHAEAHAAMQYLHLNISWIATTIALSLIFVGFIWVIADGKRANALIRNMTVELVQCEEHERCRIGTHLHDHVGQTLAAARIKLRLFRSDDKEARTSPNIDEIDYLLKESIEKMENLALDLNPQVLYQHGIRTAIDWFGQQLANAHGFRFDLTAKGQPKILDDDNAALLFRICRELLLNAAKHSQANVIRVQLGWQDNCVSITVEDDGVGFDPAVIDSLGIDARFGLVSVLNRVTSLGGLLSINSRRDIGTSVTVTVPMLVAGRASKGRAA